MLVITFSSGFPLWIIYCFCIPIVHILYTWRSKLSLTYQSLCGDTRIQLETTVYIKQCTYSVYFFPWLKSNHLDISQLMTVTLDADIYVVTHPERHMPYIHQPRWTDILLTNIYLHLKSVTRKKSVHTESLRETANWQDSHRKSKGLLILKTSKNNKSIDLTNPIRLLMHIKRWLQNRHKGVCCPNLEQGQSLPWFSLKL